MKLVRAGARAREELPPFALEAKHQRQSRMGKQEEEDERW